MDVAIVGAGYVGLVTAACLAHLGHAILCLDLDTARGDPPGAVPPPRVVIRSPLLPGSARSIAAEVHGIDPSVVVAHNPEFTREATAVRDFLAPDRVFIAIGGRA